MFSAVAFCPHPPVLVPEVAQGAAPELAELRAACHEAITAAAGSGRPVVLLGAGPASRVHAPGARGSFAGYGVPLEVSLGAGSADSFELALSLSVAAWLVREAHAACCAAVEVGPDWDGSDAEAHLTQLADADDDRALLVMGDGSARRSTAAPGYLDDGAETFDASVAEALRLGSGLARLDVHRGAHLLAAGVPAWRAAAAVLSGSHFTTELSYAAAPYGVGYFAAYWTRP